MINIWPKYELQWIVSYLRWFPTACVPCDDDHLIVFERFNEVCPVLGHWQVCLALPELFQLGKLFALYKVEVDSKNGLEGGHGPFSQSIPVIMVYNKRKSQRLNCYKIPTKTRQNGLQNNWLLWAYIANIQEIEQHFQVFKAFPTQKTATKCVAVQKFSMSQKSRHFSRCQSWPSESYEVSEGWFPL